MTADTYDATSEVNDLNTQVPNTHADNDEKPNETAEHRRRPDDNSDDIYGGAYIPW